METTISINDFNKQLYMMMSEDQENQKDENVCLITNNLLTDNFVKLNCGHTFNYESIFNEVKKQKLKYNHLEVTYLKKNEVKCPYCRTIQNGLLPYCSGFEKIRWVNHPEDYHFLPNSCIYEFKSGKKKGKACEKGCAKKYCKTHQKIMQKRKEKEKEKQQKKKLEQRKNKIKQQKIKLKEKKINKKIPKKIENINVKLSVSDPMIDIIDNMLIQVKTLQNQKEKPIVSTCNYIFKRGKYKNQQCLCKKIFKNGLCKMHYKLSTKSQK